MTFSREAVALLFLVATLTGQTPAGRTNSVRGIVIDDHTGAPVADARVVLTKADSSAGDVSVSVSDSGGAFTISDVAKGAYRLFFSRDGYVRMEYGQSGIDGIGRIIEVSEGATLPNLTIRAIATGTISGKVQDSHGRPAANANVQALRITYRNGQKILENVQSARANDLGEYRLFWLPPGKYFIAGTAGGGIRLDGDQVVVESAPGAPLRQFDAGTTYTETRMPVASAFASGIVPSVQFGVAYPSVYFSGTLDSSLASVIELGSGGTVNGIDLSVIEAAAVSVSGLIRTANTQQPGSSITISLIPRAVNGRASSGQRSTTINGPGVFKFTGVPSGKYDLVAVPMSQQPVVITAYGNPPSVSPSAYTGDARSAAHAELEVRENNIDNVALVLDQGETLKGRVEVSGQLMGGLSPSLTSVRVFLQPESAIGAIAPLPGMVSADGTFQIKSILPGRYHLTVSGLSKGMYLKSATLNQDNILVSNFNIESGSRATLQVQLGLNPAAIDVTVLDRERQQPLEAARLILVPDRDTRFRFDLFKFAFTDQKGEAHITGITPGDYRLLAIRDIEYGEWWDPQFLSTIVQRAPVLHVNESDHLLQTISESQR